MRRRLKGCAGVVAMAAMLAGANASTARAADAFRPVLQGCMSLSGGNGCPAVRAANGLWKLVVGPGGTTAYGLAWNSNALLIFDRDPSTGQLTQRGAGGCLSEDGTNGQCVVAHGLVNPADIVISPDGRQLYVSASGVNSSGVLQAGVATFDRNPISGDLTQKPFPNGCMTLTGGSGNSTGVCAVGRGIGYGTMAMSPDGRQIYAGGDSIAILQRDPNSGILTQEPGDAGCIAEPASSGCALGRGLSGNRQIALTPDGLSLYVPSDVGNSGGSLAIFDRDPASGRLAQKAGAAGCLAVTSAEGCGIEPKLTFALAAMSSPDGRQIYVSVADGILTFARAGDGTVSLQSCVNDSGSGGCAPGRMMHYVSNGAVSPDGQAVVVTLNRDDGLAVFLRDAAGNLVQQPGVDGCVSPNGAALVQGSSVPGSCVASPIAGADAQVSFINDGSFATGAYYASVAGVYKRDFYPVCADVSVGVTQNVAAAVPLSCSDRNGDGLSYQVTAAPGKGTLGAIDQAATRVFYDPFTGYLGGDSFHYSAVAGGLPSNVATVNLNVIAPPAPPKRIPTITSAVSYSWTVRGSRLSIRQLIARNLPTGAKVTLKCSGKRCPFKTKTVRRGKSSKLDVRAKLKAKQRKFRAKQTVDVRISAAGYNSKVLRFRLRARKIPAPSHYCVPLGKSKLQRSC